MTDTAPTWADIIDEPSVMLIIGTRGGGKTALSHRLLEEFEGDDRDPYIIGFPEEKEDLLPDQVELLPEDVGMYEWPEDSVVLLHESQMFLHARESMQQENLTIDKLVTISRHKNSDIIFETQMSNRLDRNAAAAVDAVICREPGLMQADFERKQIRSIIKKAVDVFDQYRDVDDSNDYRYVEPMTDEDGVELVKKHAYVHSDRFIGEYPHEISLPDHWSEEISKAYSGIDESAADDSTTGGQKGTPRAGIRGADNVKVERGEGF